MNDFLRTADKDPRHLEQVLIVFEEIPEQTRFFIAEISYEEYVKLSLIHGTICHASKLSDAQEEIYTWFNDWIEAQSEIKMIEGKPMDLYELGVRSLFSCGMLV